MSEWIEFDPNNWATQQHPPERKLVLVQAGNRALDGSLVPLVAVGYLRYAAGCKDSPRFVLPGVTHDIDSVSAWCDCLPEGFGVPLWPGFPPAPQGVE